MLHFRPGLVDEKSYFTGLWELPYDYSSAELLESGPLVTYSPFQENSETGTLGDTKHATAEKNERLFEPYCDDLGSVLLDINDHLVAKAQ